MKYFILVILLAINPINDLDKIATVNKHKKQAREAYNNGNYEEALTHYRLLVDSLDVREPEVVLNYGNTLYQLKDTTRAIEPFASLYDTSDKEIRSVANQQLGVIHNKLLQEPEAALQYFKQALKANPANEDARYNYEMLKKALKEQEDQEQDKNDQEKDQQDKDQDQQNKDQQKQDQQNQQQQQDQQQKDQQESEQDQQKKDGEEGEENEDPQQQDQEQQKEGEEKEKKDQQQQDGDPDEQDDQQNQEQQNAIAEKLKDMKISEEKARMILEAMKNNEIQYFQQNKRKPTKKKDSSKPDW